jgi:hypothetical protein
MTKWLRVFLSAALFAAGFFPLASRSRGAGPAPDPHVAPRLQPDYAGIVVPPNIAPLDFRILDPGVKFRVAWHAPHGNPIQITSRTPVVRIPQKRWSELLRANAGEPLLCDIATQDSQGRWTQFVTITNQVAREEIDNYIAYRLLKPLFNSYVHVGIYQRDLRSFEQRPILENDEVNLQCLNCHTFLNRRPDTFALHTRTSTNLHPMALVWSNQISRVDQTMGYLSWHPSGRLLAFSANKLSLFSHTLGETRDVYDAQSDLGIYRVDSNLVVYPPPISLTNRNETWPNWSPDGRYLYYSAADPKPLEQFRKIRYDLMRVSYDIGQDRWGEPEMLVSSQETSRSACEPRVSPDGRFVMFCLCNYGNFPIYQTNTDLYLLDLATRKFRRLDINSPQADSWHCWSSNGRWVVFSSKRLDGLFARPFFSHMDQHGEFSKPFLLPQQDPDFYDSFLQTFNLPEFVLGPVQVTQDRLAPAFLNPDRRLVPSTASPRPNSPDASQGAGEGESSYRAPTK